tara:strand:+ start:419 stop:1198 length:780 start_codon:yes stop_codon:yes gene_type:complete
MKEALNICLLQYDLHWEDALKNRTQIDTYLAEVTGADIILLPELFSTGFSVASTHLAETMDGETLVWMKAQAKKKKTVLCGSVMIEDKGRVFNRLLWVDPNGRVHYYDKRHLFSLIEEDKHFTAGTERLIIEYEGWKICPMICYDLRFPVFARNDVDYDLLLFVANWPDTRISAWDVLLKARAIENQAYVIGLNRVGTDGFNAQYPGHSHVLDPEGDCISMAPEYEVGLVEVTLSKNHLTECRKRHPFLSDRDAFTITD